MSADKGLMRGFPIQTKFTFVHTGLQVTLAGRTAVELGKANKDYLPRRGRTPALPAKVGPFRRGLLLSAWSASMREQLARTRPKGHSTQAKGCAALMHTLTHRQLGTTGGSPAAWWHPSSCAYVLEAPPHQAAQKRAYLEAKRDCLKSSQGKQIQSPLQSTIL